MTDQTDNRVLPRMDMTALSHTTVTVGALKRHLRQYSVDDQRPVVVRVFLDPDCKNWADLTWEPDDLVDFAAETSATADGEPQTEDTAYVLCNTAGYYDSRPGRTKVFHSSDERR